MIDALVLCGGHGTRLASVFDGPKFLAPITSSHDRVCDRIIEYLRSWSFIGSIILAAGAQRERIAAANLPVDVVDPISCARGTLDAVARACLFGDTFLVVNGDTLLDLDLAAAYTVHIRAESEATCIYLRSELDQEVHPAGVRFLSSAARDSLRSSSLTDLDMSLDTIGTLRLYPRGSFLDLGTPEGLALARFPINHRSAR